MGIAYQGDCNKLTVLHLCIYLLVVVEGGAHRKAGPCFWRSEDTLEGLVLSYHGDSLGWNSGLQAWQLEP